MKLIGDRSPPSQHDPVFDFAMSTWWLSVDQITYAIKLAGGDLWQGLRNVRHITTCSGDFLYDLHASHNLNRISQALLDASAKTNARALI
ncbi:hypothetical protein [Rhodospirillum sp. A1_3_36]|uniref:hypothetical protein n=1 Tax=Rhodospirillum sp. A1_3_36 TaxID=3391666 RepID=UPI0039A733B0